MAIKKEQKEAIVPLSRWRQPRLRVTSDADRYPTPNKVNVGLFTIKVKLP